VNILIVSQYFWPENFRINDLTAGLVNRGHNVTVLTGIPNYPAGRFFPGYGLFKKKRQRYCGAEVVRIPLIPRGKGGPIPLALNYLSFAFLASVLAPFLCREKIDILFVCQQSPVTVGLPALVLKRLKRRPILLWILDLWPESFAATSTIRSHKVLEAVEKVAHFIYRGADRILVVSLGFVPSLCARGIERERIDYFPNWVEPEYGTVQIHNLHTEGPRLPGGFQIMFAGNIGVAQDFETILAAAEKLKTHPDINFVVIGDGRRFEWLKDEVQRRSLHGHMHLLGRHEPGEMSSFFAQADAMLVTLKKDSVFSMTVPGKIQSYMACGRPIVAALDGEGARVIKESGAGLVSPAEDSEGLANIILAMYRMPRLDREAMGRQGREYCESNFKRDALIDRLESWIQEMITSDR